MNIDICRTYDESTALFIKVVRATINSVLGTEFTIIGERSVKYSPKQKS